MDQRGEVAIQIGERREEPHEQDGPRRQRHATGNDDHQQRSIKRYGHAEPLRCCSRPTPVVRGMIAGWGWGRKGSWPPDFRRSGRGGCGMALLR